MPKPSLNPEAEWTTRRLLDWIAPRLEEHNVDAPRLCAELLLAGAIGCDRMRLYMEPERLASDVERERLREWVRRACGHEPVQYLLGEAWFHGRPFEVDSCTLIPRPSTETLVECATAHAARIEAPRVLEIGTGTGCIATSIVGQLDRPARAESRRRAAAVVEAGCSGLDEPGMPQPTAAIVVATELIPAAAELARRNIERHSLSDHIEVRVGSLYEPLREEEMGSFDLLVSNPPYVSDTAWAECDANVRLHEPETALRGGADGLDVTRPLVAGAGDWLREAGLLVIEIQHDQAEPVVRLFEAAGFGSTEVHLDFEGHERVVSGRATSR